MFVNSTAIAISRHRVLNVARAVEEADHSQDKIEPGLIKMTAYVKPCGTPACAFGHYAARPDLQDTFRLSEGMIFFIRNGIKEIEIGYSHPIVARHFGLQYTELEELFSSEGCGVGVIDSNGCCVINYVEPKRVVTYIRQFVVRKWPQWSAA